VPFTFPNAAGRLDKAPKRATLKRDHEENKKITQAINEENEQQFAGVAAATGGKLAVLRPPIAATADQKQKTA